ncbi:MAG TPA: hypothetical protein VFS90_18085 [Pyrinomonadaceae bacterium]|nr:hypothetical protein [Pyrinomonadaceae bacterium]
MVRFCSAFFPQRRKGAKLIVIAVLLLVVGSASAQSIDPNAPSPVRSNSITGSIAARDLGDARLTDHYYAFTGTPGDLLITINSRNLNGDVDVFTAGTLRPLLKLTLYAESTSPVTKGIYLRKREDLILRIEARSPNDDEGTYRLFFGGSFEPIVGGPEIAEAETSATPVTETRTPGTKRVTSVGARINEPEPPVTEVATATPEPTPEPTPEAKPVEKPTPEKSPEVETARPATARNTRGRRPAARRPAPRVRETPPAPVEEPKPKPAPPEPEAEVGPRLVIETNDGTLINRSMSTVKRVTVENGQVVVTGKDGKIDRILLVNVVRMSIAP